MQVAVPGKRGKVSSLFVFLRLRLCLCLCVSCSRPKGIRRETGRMYLIYIYIWTQVPVLCVLPLTPVKEGGKGASTQSASNLILCSTNRGCRYRCRCRCGSRKTKQRKEIRLLWLLTLVHQDKKGEGQLPSVLHIPHSSVFSFFSAFLLHLQECSWNDKTLQAQFLTDKEKR